MIYAIYMYKYVHNYSILFRFRILLLFSSSFSQKVGFVRSHFVGSPCKWAMTSGQPCWNLGAPILCQHTRIKRDGFPFDFPGYDRSEMPRLLGKTDSLIGYGESQGSADDARTFKKKVQPAGRWIDSPTDLWSSKKLHPKKDLNKQPEEKILLMMILGFLVEFRRCTVYPSHHECAMQWHIVYQFRLILQSFKQDPRLPLDIHGRCLCHFMFPHL